MSKTVVLVLLPPEDKDTDAFREIVANDAFLGDRVDLRFASGDAVKDAIGGAEILNCGNISPELLRSAQKVRWVSYWSAGMDGKVTPEMLARNLILTNASGVHGPNIAEHVMAFMLMFARRMHLYLRSQQDVVWQRFDHAELSKMGELSGRTLGIVGLGRIGEALMARARAFDMRVIAVKRDVTHRYGADVAPDALYRPEELPLLLSQSDHVCIAVPNTPDTFHLFDAAMLAHMKPTAYLYNIARGKIVDEAALIDALQNSRLAGAGLDVFETEPLSAASPLWRMDNVILTPHTAGLTPYYFKRVAALFAANLRLYLAGQPLQNRYDPSRGY